MLTVCLLWIRARACERVKADRKWVEADLSPYVRHYPSAAALCLFMRLPHHFQLHGPQTRPLIPSHFPVKVCQLRLSSCTFRSAHLHQQLQRSDLMQNRKPTHPILLYINTHISSYRLVHTDMFAQYVKPVSVFADSQVNRTVLLLINPRVGVNTKTVVSLVRFLIGNHAACRTGACLSLSC